MMIPNNLASVLQRAFISSYCMHIPCITSSLLPAKDSLRYTGHFCYFLLETYKSKEK